MKRILEQPKRIGVPVLLVFNWILFAIIVFTLVVVLGWIRNPRDFEPGIDPRLVQSLVLGLIGFVIGGTLAIWSLAVARRWAGLLYGKSDGSSVQLATLLRTRFRPEIAVSRGTKVLVEVRSLRDHPLKIGSSSKWVITAGVDAIRFRTTFEPDAQMLSDLETQLRELGLEPMVRLISWGH